MHFCFTVDDVGLDGYSTELHLERVLAFCDGAGVKATLFVVPRTGNTDLRARPDYVRALRRAVAAGHEAAQHGLDHDRFECGIPPAMVLDLPHEGPARERLARERDVIQAGLSIERIRARLAEGRRIMEEALGLKVAGFRAPCLQICDNLFHALEAERYVYDSSRHLQPAGWDLLNGRENITPSPITREIYDQCQYPGRLRVLPLTAEYTWYLTRQRYDATMELARHDARACQAAGIPFVPICHVSPVQEGDARIGFQFYRELCGYARELCHRRSEELRCVTLSETCAALTEARKATQ